MRPRARRGLRADAGADAQPRCRSGLADTSLGAARFDAIVDAAITAQARPGLGDRAHGRGSPTARASLRRRGDAAQVLDFIDAWEGDAEALAAVYAAADATPDGRPCVLACAARVSDRAGDEDRPSATGAWLALGPNYGPDDRERRLRRCATAGLTRRWAPRTYYYGTYPYRRRAAGRPAASGAAGPRQRPVEEVRRARRRSAPSAPHPH